MDIKINYGSSPAVFPDIRGVKGWTASDISVLAALCFEASLRGDLNALATAVKSTTDAVQTSLAFWSAAGIITEADLSSVSGAAEGTKVPDVIPLPPDVRPSYTGKELAEVIDSTNGLKRLIDECQRIAGKLFSMAEIGQLVGLVDYLHLDAEYVIMLFMYCVERDKKSVRYIVQTAYNLADEGIATIPHLEEYMQRHSRLNNLTGRLRKLFGFGDRELTAKEDEYVNRWCMEFGYEFDVIKRAYEITIESTSKHKLSLPYLNKILQNWNTAGYRTLDEVDAALAAYRRSREEARLQTVVPESSFSTDEFFELALKRSYEKLSKNSSGGKDGN
ncbi:MAG: DnaD domain protein [Clostridiales bacterium]|nr:DnaD domain protein [Clostridiales bacterium]